MGFRAACRELIYTIDVELYSSTSMIYTMCLSVPICSLARNVTLNPKTWICGVKDCALLVFLDEQVTATAPREIILKKTSKLEQNRGMFFFSKRNVPILERLMLVSLQNTNKVKGK